MSVETLLKAKGLARKGDVDGASQLFAAVLEQFPQNKEATRGSCSISSAEPRATQAPVAASGQDLQSLVTLI